LRVWRGIAARYAIVALKRGIKTLSNIASTLSAQACLAFGGKWRARSARRQHRRVGAASGAHRRGGIALNRFFIKIWHRKSAQACVAPRSAAWRLAFASIAATNGAHRWRP
jgi:hypothetical protein